MAAACAFLLSDYARFVNGPRFRVDGGPNRNLMPTHDTQ